jgi:hypothetical protein
VAAVPSGLSLTPLRIIKKIKKIWPPNTDVFTDEGVSHSAATALQDNKVLEKSVLQTRILMLAVSLQRQA